MDALRHDNLEMEEALVQQGSRASAVTAGRKQGAAAVLDQQLAQ